MFGLLMRRIVIYRRAAKARKAGVFASTRSIHPISFVISGSLIYGVFWGISLVPNSPAWARSLYSSTRADIWEVLAILSTLAVALQVMAINFSSKGNSEKELRTLKEHTERYLSATPLLVSTFVVILLIDHFLSLATVDAPSGGQHSFLQMFAAGGIGWIILVLCSDAHNRFMGSELLKDERERLARRRDFRELRSLRLRQPPKPIHDFHHLGFIVNFIREAALSLLIVHLVFAGTATIRKIRGESPFESGPVSGWIMEYVQISINWTALCWVFASTIVIFLGLFRFLDYVSKFFWAFAGLMLCIVPFSFAWGSLVGAILIPIFCSIGFLLQIRVDRAGEVRWILGTHMLPGDSARELLTRAFWRHHETVYKRLH